MHEIYEYRRQGLSVSAISKHTGYDRKTVRKYLHQSAPAAEKPAAEKPVFEKPAVVLTTAVGAAPVPVYGPRAPRPSKLDPFKPFLQERMQAGVWNGNVLLHELRERGYDGGHSILRAYLSPLRSQAAVLAVRRFETPPGLQAQVDWGDLGTVTIETSPGGDSGGRGLRGERVGAADTAGTAGGTRTRLSVFALTLGHSRALFAEVALDQKLPCFVRLHEAAFAALGGVPCEILYDRCKTVVLRELLQDGEATLDERGQVRWNPVFLDFARYWGFTPRLCRAYRPQTKGKIESGVKFVRRNFLPGLRCLDDAGRPALSVQTASQVSQRLQTWLWEVANQRLHGTTYRHVHEALEEERPHLQPLAGRAPYRLPDEVLEQRRVARDAFVSYRGNRYSVPWRLTGRTVGVEERAGLLELRYQGEVVARHALATMPHSIVQQADHFQDMPFGPSSGASTGASTGAGYAAVSHAGKERIHLRLLPDAQVPVVEHRSLDCYEELLQELAAPAGPVGSVGPMGPIAPIQEARCG